MKALLLSNRPKWCEKICHEIGKDENGKPIYEKVIEVRKSAPKEVPFKSYIYCTKEHANEIVLLKDYKNRFRFGDYRNADDHFYSVANGKVIGEFICDKVDKYDFHKVGFPELTTPTDCYLINDNELGEMCLSYANVIEYGKGKTLYGWHISDLKIYDKPRELSEFRKACESGCWCYDCKDFDYDATYNGEDNAFCNKKPITRPPQSWCYVEEDK